VVSMGRRAIVVTLLTGLLFGFVQVYVKFSNPEFALTHWFNDTSYYIKVGFVILIASAVFLYRARPRLVLAMMLLSVGVKLGLEGAFPGLAYFNVTALTILIGFAVVAAEALWRTRRPVSWREIWHSEDRLVTGGGLALLGSLVALQVAFH
jgi:SSS family solute:Na+ symporter